MKRPRRMKRKASPKIKLPRSTSVRINMMFSDSDTSLEDLRLRRDMAARDGDMRLAMACAIAIDKVKGYYK